MQASTDSSADFTGVFIKWQYHPGQKYVQLLFETASGMRLSLSRNRHFFRSLTVGRSYRIKGKEYSVGGKTYVHEPTAIPLEAAVARSGRGKKFFVFFILVVLAGAASAYFVAGQQTSQANITETKKTISTKAAPQANLTSSKVPAAAPVTSPAVPAAAAPVAASKPPTKKTAISAPTAQNPPAAAAQNTGSVSEPEVQVPKQQASDPAGADAQNPNQGITGDEGTSAGDKDEAVGQSPPDTSTDQ
jgi:hypothetical protein